MKNYLIIDPHYRKLIAKILLDGYGTDYFIARCPFAEGEMQESILIYLSITQTETSYEAIAWTEFSCSPQIKSISLGTACEDKISRIKDFLEEVANSFQSEPEPGLEEKPAAPDMINQPPHYTGHPSGIECIEVAEHLPFNIGCAYKYLFRRDHKNTRVENLRKAIWYLEREIKRQDIYPGQWIMAIPDQVFDKAMAISGFEKPPYSTLLDITFLADQPETAITLIKSQIEGK